MSAGIREPGDAEVLNAEGWNQQWKTPCWIDRNHPPSDPPSSSLLKYDREQGFVQQASKGLAGLPANLCDADPDGCSLSDLATPLTPDQSKTVGSKKNRKWKKKQKQKHRQPLQSGNNQRGVLCAGRSAAEADNIPHVDQGDALYQVKLSPHQHDGNIEINQGVAGVPPVSYAAMLKRGLGYSLAETMQSPSIASPRPLNDLVELEDSCGDLKTNICEQALIAIPASIEDIALGVNTRADPSSPPGDVHGEEALTAKSTSDGVSIVSQESKLNNFSPLAREVAARIKVLLRAEDKSAHRDEALPCRAYPGANFLSPRLQDSSLKAHKSILKKPYFRQLVQYNPRLINEKEMVNWVSRKTRASHKGPW